MLSTLAQPVSCVETKSTFSLSATNRASSRNGYECNFSLGTSYSRRNSSAFIDAGKMFIHFCSEMASVVWKLSSKLCSYSADRTDLANWLPVGWLSTIILQHLSGDRAWCRIVQCHNRDPLREPG